MGGDTVMALFRSLNDEFDSHQGMWTDSFIDGGSTTYMRHYDIRAFNGSDLTVPRTLPDFRYWNADHFNGMNMTTLDAPRSIEGYSVAARTMAELDAEYDQSELGAETLQEIELYALATGGEGWPVGDPNVTFGKDSALRWSPSIRVTLTSAVTKTVTSTFRDNLIADFPVDGVTTYYIELALPDFPAQAAPSHLDLANSYIDFTSSPTYVAGDTDSFRFDQSLVSLTGGGDLYWRINRNSLVNVDLANITGIRFRLRSVGNMTFVAQAMRQYQASQFGFPGMGIDTKRNVFKRIVPQVGVDPAIATVDINNAVAFSGTRPSNVTQIVKFNTGHLTANSAYIDLIARWNPDVNYNLISTYLGMNTTGTSFGIRERTNGVDLVGLNTASGAALANETDYYYVWEIIGDQVKASLYRAQGAFFGPLILATAWTTTTRLGRGHVGYQVTADNYDFSVDWIKNKHAEFASYKSVGQTSITPYAGATLYPKATPPQDLAGSTLIPSGDATVTLDGTKGDPAPSYKFVRSGISWFGGFQSTDFLFIGDPKHLVVRGKIFPPVAGRTYRALLIDKADTVSWIVDLENLQINQWNDFEIPVNANIAPANYRFVLQQVGFHNDTFWMQDIHLEHDTFAWSASPDGGQNWYNFYNVLGEQYNSANFKSNPVTDRTNLVVRASALSDNARIQGYEIIPTYEYPGHSD
jgi:hypothetical protein